MSAQYYLPFLVDIGDSNVECIVPLTVDSESYMPSYLICTKDGLEARDGGVAFLRRYAGNVL